MKKIGYLMIVTMLIFSLLPILTPSPLEKVTAGSPPPPDDNVNGSYTQYIDGDWTITNTQNYTDEIIVLTGNLTIEAGGELTLKNVTLMMNCTSADGQYKIEVLDGGKLELTDKDNDPTTIDDNSNITDSPFDGDNDTGYDFEYSFKILEGAMLSIQNSLVRECGFSGAGSTNYGLYIKTDNIIIQNTSFIHNYHGIIATNVDNAIICYNNFSHSVYGLVFSSSVNFGNRIYNNEMHHTCNGMIISGDNFKIYNNYVHNNSKTGVYLSHLDDSDFYNNTIKYNGGTSSRYNLEIYYCFYLNIYKNIIQKVDSGSYYAVKISMSRYINFHNNTVTDNDNWGIQWVFMMNAINDFRFINNNVSNNKGTGLYIQGGFSIYYTRIEIRNNVFYNNFEDGIYLYYLTSYVIQNNTISSNVTNSGGVYAYSTWNGDFSNNTVKGDAYDFKIYDDWFEIVNCTCNPSNSEAAIGGMLIAKNFLHLNVTDINGPAPGVNITIKDKKDAIVFEGKTNKNGYLRYLKLTNQTVNWGGQTFFDPHNVTATSKGNIAYGEIEPTMNKSQTLRVIFNTDLPPETPKNLRAVSNGTNVDLRWRPSYSPDLSHYLIYRNGTGSNWWEIYNTSNAPSPTSANWSDIQGASNSSTYYYKVLAVDEGFQKSNYSNIAKCGDWAIPDTRLVTNSSVLLNGSLVILDTGNLTLKNTTINFNNSYKTEFGIEVKPGGKLFIMDYDNNPLTTSDRSNISAIDPDYNIYFIVNGSEFVMQNSKLSNCGSNDQLDYFSWLFQYNALDVISVGYPWTRGLYANCNKVIIKNNEFSDNFVAILLNNTNNSTIKENTFYDNTFGVYLHNSQYNVLKINTFETHETFPIYLYNSGNNTIYSNNITNPIISKPGIVIIHSRSHQNKIFHNNISNGGVGIALYKAGMNNNISFNNFYDLYWSIYIENTDHSILINNYFNNTGTYNINLLYSDFTIINGVEANWGHYTITTSYSDNLIISDIEIENMTSHGIGLNSNNVKLSDISLKSSGSQGISIRNGDTITLTNITIETCTIGLYCWDYSKNMKLVDSKIFNNVQNAIKLINCEEFIIDNCTFDATSLNFNLTNGIVTLYNTTYNQSKVKLDPSSSISLYWLLDVDVIDWFGNPCCNSNIQIRNVFGTLIYNGFTDSNGYVKWIWLLERTQYRFTNDTGNPYNIKAGFSNHTGSTNLVIDITTNTTVFLENILPMVSNVIITPLNPTTVSDLTVSYKYSDQEFDDEGSTMIKWYVNGIHNDTLDDQITIDRSATRKGQTWYCEIIPHDGDDYGSSMASPPVTVQNTPPEVSNVKIEELNPSSSDDLHVNYSYFDIDNDPETRSTHRWLVNDGTGWKYSGNDVMILAWTETKKGEQWKCEVTPGDGDDNGAPVESQVVIINNTAPETFDVIIQPETPKSNETLEVNYTYFDLDNDPESTSPIKWYKNGEEQFNLAGNFKVDHSLTSKGDSWHYMVTPFDSEDYGFSVNSTVVVIENTAPEVFKIVIEPANPTTADDLTVIYEFYDEDGDTESYETIVEWLKWSGVEFTHTGLRVHTLSSSYTSKSEIWTCEITPHDSYIYGETVRASISISIENSVPTVSDFYITPIAPTTKDDLTSNYDYGDLDNELENGTEIQWFCKGEQIPELVNKLSVPSDFTEKGQSWYFTVRPRDGFEFGEIAASDPVIIQNSAPTASNLTITPRFPLGDDKLVAAYFYSDPDGDNESTPEIKWYKDGEHQGIYDDKFEVEAEATGKGDNWYFTIRVHDGVEWSDEVRSYNVRIENSKPIINSISPDPGQLEINETDSIEFFVDVLDPDGDFLNINWRVNKVLTGSDVFHLFETDHQSAGDYEINLTIQDLGENSFTLSYDWAITVHNVNRAPQIKIEEPLVNNPRVKEDSTIKFEVTANDVDEDDTLKITWYLDDVVIPDSTGSTLNFRATHANIGNRVIRVEVTDTYDTVGSSWNLTVEEETVELGPLGLEWDVWGIMIEVIVLAVTGLLAFIGYRKLRKKKGALKIYLEEIETISKLKDKSPDKYERKLTDLEERINAEFKEGKIEDLHYLMLQEVLAGHRGEYRRAEVTRKFRSLPQGIAQNLDGMLKDGKITREEYMAFATTMKKSKSLTPYEKRELSRMIGKWKVEDKDAAVKGSVTKKLKPKEKVEMAEWEDDDEDLDEE